MGEFPERLNGSTASTLGCTYSFTFEEEWSKMEQNAKWKPNANNCKNYYY